MYIWTTTNGKGVSYYHLVESYRDPSKVKQRTLLSLGKVEDGKLEQLAVAISKHTDKISVFNLAKDIEINDMYILGDLAIYETSFSDDRCIITWSRVRADRDRKPREEVLDKCNIGFVKTCL